MLNINGDYFVLGECARFPFTSCEDPATNGRTNSQTSYKSNVYHDCYFDTFIYHVHFQTNGGLRYSNLSTYVINRRCDSSLTKS